VLARSRTTIREVAAAAGVSHQTVSRVINLSERVDPETRSRVEAAIDRLNYRPNAIARYMAQGRTQTLACISPNLSDYTFAAIIEAAEAEARRQGYFLFSASAASEAAFSDLIGRLVDSRLAEGLLVINPYADGRHALLPRSVPSVFVGARPRQESVDSVSLDDESAARLAAAHLLQAGHRRIAMVTGPGSEDCVQDRCAGFSAALAAAGVSLPEAWVLLGDWSATAGYEAMMHLHRSGNLPTAIFAQNDRIAIGVMRAARDVGLSVPENLSVVGVDDMPLASYFDPPLTTIRQDMGAIGREATGLLLHGLEEPGAARRHIRLPAELVIRGSTAPISA
jgi:DNA-binding LacI/PurR family transcriptional regulator